MLQSIIVFCLAAQCLAQSNQYLPPDEGYSYKPPQVPFPSNPGIVSQPPPSPPVGPPSPSLPPPGPNTPYPPASRPPSGPGAPIAGNAPVSHTSILRQAWNDLLTALFLLLQWWRVKNEWLTTVNGKSLDTSNFQFNFKTCTIGFELKIVNTPISYRHKLTSFVLTTGKDPSYPIS